MKTHILTTKDELQYRITDEEARVMGKLLDEGKSIVINGDRIINADQPRIRRIPRAPKSMMQLADGVFNNGWIDSTTRLDMVRPDKNRHAIFEPHNESGKYCGKCMNGWLPGDYGMKLCPCNPLNQRLTTNNV